MNEIVDASQLLGAEITGDTYSTVIDDTISIQIAYHFLGPMSEYRSVDGDEENILSWRPDKETWQRHREWRESGFRVPRDLSLSEDAIGVLIAVRGVTRDASDGEIIEIYLPPLTPTDARRIKHELLIEHDIKAVAGEGRAPLLIEDPESVEKAQSFQKYD